MTNFLSNHFASLLTNLHTLCLSHVSWKKVVTYVANIRGFGKKMCTLCYGCHVGLSMQDLLTDLLTNFLTDLHKNLLQTFLQTFFKPSYKSSNKPSNISSNKHSSKTSNTVFTYFLRHSGHTDHGLVFNQSAGCWGLGTPRTSSHNVYN